MIKLGDKVKDSITGFEGIAVSRTEYLFGCVRIGVEAKKRKDDGEAIEAWFDEQRLTKKSKAKTGGPFDPPPARSTPKR